MADQSHACAFVLSPGSSTIGNAKSARKDPKLERAYKRYGEPLWIPLYQDCKSGPVDERTKYGRPTLTLSSATICQTGLSAPLGFQLDPGVSGEFHAVDAQVNHTSDVSSSTQCR